VGQAGRLKSNIGRSGPGGGRGLDAIARQIDWVIKYQLIERYRAVHNLPLSAPQIAQADLAYLTSTGGRGLYRAEVAPARTGAFAGLDAVPARSAAVAPKRARCLSVGPGVRYRWGSA
jgi:hypothetical protein